MSNILKMKRLLIIPILLFFACQSEEINSSDLIDLDGIYSALNYDFNSITNEVKNRKVSLNNTSEVASLAKEYYNLEDLGTGGLNRWCYGKWY